MATMRLFKFLILCLLPANVVAQTDNGRAMSIEIPITDTTTTTLSSELWPLGLYSNFGFNPALATTRREFAEWGRFTPTTNLPPEETSLINWNGGAVSLDSGHQEMPGFMGMENGSIAIVQHIGNFTFSAEGIVNRYGFFRSVDTQYGLGGALQYDFAPNLSVSVFATHYFPTAIERSARPTLSPAIAGYYMRSAYGATVNYQITDHFGLIIGGEAVKNFATNRYHFEPIVTPTFKIGKVGFGLPVGQLVNEMVKSNIERRNAKRYIQNRHK